MTIHERSWYEVTKKPVRHILHYTFLNIYYFTWTIEINKWFKSHLFCFFISNSFNFLFFCNLHYLLEDFCISGKFRMSDDGDFWSFFFSSHYMTHDHSVFVTSLCFRALKMTCIKSKRQHPTDFLYPWLQPIIKIDKIKGH